MIIIAIENSVVVDIFESDNEDYISSRKEARHDILWLENKICNIGQVYDIETDTFSNQDMPVNPNPVPYQDPIQKLELAIQMQDFRIDLLDYKISTGGGISEV